MNSTHRNRIGFLFLSSLLALTVVACVSAPDSTKDNGQAVDNVRSVIQAQQAAWNRGDIEGFMGGYERAETTTFISGDELTRGWQTVLERYKRRYTSPEQMGTLTFSEIEIYTLNPLHVLADGRWKLTRAADTPHGRFTLLFRQTNNGWRIIHDTTTSAMQ